MGTNLLQRMLSIRRTNFPNGLAIFLGGALILGLVSVFTFRITEGATLLLSTMAACAILYGLSARHDKWN
jgi:hypothetical protein